MLKIGNNAYILWCIMPHIYTSKDGDLQLPNKLYLIIKLFYLLLYVLINV